MRSGTWKSLQLLNHAEEALDYVREHPVDIVISDVNMPDKTGLEMVQESEEHSYQNSLLYPSIWVSGI